MALLTIAQFAEHFTHDLGDDAIQRLLDDAEAAIIQRFGEHATQTEHLDGGTETLTLARGAASITSAVETIAEADTTLAADDYSLENGGLVVRRESSGTNGRQSWGDRVAVVYVPATDTNRRIRVQADLVKLALQYDGMNSQRIGDISFDTRDYQRRREEILSELIGFGVY